MDMPTDMQHQAMGYDRAAQTFSPDGHILQVEYAEKTVRLGSSSIGMVCVDGVFILADKRTEDKLIVKKSANKIYEIDENIIASVAGITADARVLIEKAQVLAQQHRITYDSQIEPELMIKEISNVKQQFTQYGGARPFGVSLMLAGIHGKVSELYTSDVTGNYFSYYANAIGENDDRFKELLREKYAKELTLKKGIKLALDIFKEVQGKKFDLNRFELVYINCEDRQQVRLEGEEIEKL
ncbi:archaeal proteasome endopeptidase complex subunit alpha [archaeon]|jgi:proteasome alpha subunit|nr:archaeal proteasome endopeptidase complex subunit alpha [archaeon]MBT4373599.1 archaeal proteasome endopeptidase complex subunit alpha [archaeon]MBT4532047.1 archaeal proteasome endopeptidase complex subunit alpha [archaeon]MBT7001714.1 archaeal proteasome endopeptidase complex subunit alpha [archaeon]MBT7282394.1 archaeal proteasome endopeptidase complex subunit alpha [archaeon]